MKNNIIFYGPPGTGKTYNAKRSALNIISEYYRKNPSKDIRQKILFTERNFSEESFIYALEQYTPQIQIVSLHEGMTPSDLIMGISIEALDGNAYFTETEKAVVRLINEVNESKRPGILILDDIHRIDLSGVIGELLYGFLHRNEPVTLSNGHTICVPEELYVFMTMNSFQVQNKLDLSLLKQFEVIEARSNEHILEEVINEIYYKALYYTAGVDLWVRLCTLLLDKNKCKNDIGRNCASTAIKGQLEELISMDFTKVLSNDEIEKLLAIDECLSKKDLNKANEKADSDKSFLECISEIIRFYKANHSLLRLNQIVGNAVKEYKKYNEYIDFVSAEYEQDKEKIKIGFSYFLPAVNGESIWNADELLKNKIRAQVLPLIKQYIREGIIVGCGTPNYQDTSTRYVRGDKPIDMPITVLERINITENTESYRDIFLRQYREKAATTYTEVVTKENGKTQNITRYYCPDPDNTSHGVNATYGVLFEIVRDIVVNPLISYWQIMDILCRDTEVFCRIGTNAADRGCLLVPFSKRKGFIAGDQGEGNGNGSLKIYRADLHSFMYQGEHYVLYSKLDIGESIAKYKSDDQDVSNYRLEKPIPNNRRHSLFPIVKVLVYDYLLLYRENCVEYMKQIDDSVELLDLESIVKKIDSDLDTLNSLKYRGEDKDEVRWNLLEDIQNLEILKAARNRMIKGVYKIMDHRYQSVMDKTGIHQMIMQGPPGTSKTHGVKQFLAEQIGILDENGEWNKDKLESHQLKTNRETDEYELPTIDKNEVYWDIIQFHPSYTYEDFVRGISVVAAKSKTVQIQGEVNNDNGKQYDFSYNIPSSLSYKTVNRTLGKMAKIAENEKERRFYLVIDEINRANLATVFGELIYALEYRGGKGVVTPYSIDNEPRIVIPDNMYIIGTMNTADKSVASIDYAIRRRFLFFPLLPKITTVVNSVSSNEPEKEIEVKLFYIIKKLFEYYLNSDDYNLDDIQIGHTFFLRKTKDVSEAKEQMMYRFLYQVLPILKEYYHDGILLEEETSDDTPSEDEMAAFKTINKLLKCTDDYNSEVLFNDLIGKLVPMENLISKDIKLSQGQSNGDDD